MKENESTNNGAMGAEIGARFQALRVKGGLSLKTVREQGETSASEYLRLENGSYTPTPAQFRALLGCFGVGVDAFVETLSPQAGLCARELLRPDRGSAAPAAEETPLELSDNKPGKPVWGKSTD